MKHITTLCLCGGIAVLMVGSSWLLARYAFAAKPRRVRYRRVLYRDLGTAVPNTPAAVTPRPVLPTPQQEDTTLTTPYVRDMHQKWLQYAKR